MSAEPAVARILANLAPEIKGQVALEVSPVVTDPPGGEGGDNVAVAPDGFRLTDAGNAQRLVTLSNGMVRYAHAWGRWIVYRHGRWIIDHNDVLITEMAKTVSRSLMSLVPRLTDDERRRVFSAAMRAESAGAINAMVKLARGIPGVVVEHEDLDANPYILNCTNGTVDLDSGVLRAHNPADLCTQQCPVAFDPNAEAPLWNECLERWQPDAEVRGYLQREAGAGACGRQTETLSIHLGQGGNGKSKFFGAIQRVLGPYVVVPHKSLIIASRHEQHATVIASLFRARLAIAAETSARAWLNESLVKNLTGGDRLSARRMREDEWEFAPSHTLVLFSNHRPEIRGTDEGMWRRVRLIPWNVTIPEAERDEALGEKLAAEAPGILRWVVDGCGEYLANGLEAPECIKASTADYRAGEDTVGRCLHDIGVEYATGGRVMSSALTAAHEAWCMDNGVEREKEHWKRVTIELAEKGARAGRTKSQRYWTGITMSEDGEVAPDPSGIDSDW